MSKMFDQIVFDENSRALIDTLSREFKTMVLMVSDLPNNREKSIALTKLEEASMWFNKAVKHWQLEREELKRIAELRDAETMKFEPGENKVF